MEDSLQKIGKYQLLNDWNLIFPTLYSLVNFIFAFSLSYLRICLKNNSSYYLLNP